MSMKHKKYCKSSENNFIKKISKNRPNKHKKHSNYQIVSLLSTPHHYNQPTKKINKKLSNQNMNK